MSGDSFIYACDANALLNAIDNGRVESILSYKDCQSSTCPCSIENGFIVNIKHSGGIVSYCHVGYMVPNIVEGAVLSRGQQIGAIGSGGRFELVVGQTSYTKSDIELANSCDCVPNCVGKNCGSDGCGGSCGSCSNSTICADGVCTCIARNPEETGAVCGDNGCGGEFKYCEEQKSCQYDGSVYQCVAVDGKTESDKCIPQCRTEAGEIVRHCGDDGCGGTCGSCPKGMICQANQCVCEDSCNGRQCGMNACGESCGTCPDGTSCDEITGVCRCVDEKMNVAAMNCVGVQCGQRDSVCGAVCPCAGSSQYDTDYKNESCGENSCGKYDEMGGRCGRCSYNRICHVKLGCLKSEKCTPKCAAQMCGDDGCGGTCGICGPGYHCTSGVCVAGGNGHDVKMLSDGCNAMPLSKTKASIWAALLGFVSFVGLIRRRKIERGRID